MFMARQPALFVLAEHNSFPFAKAQVFTTHAQVCSHVMNKNSDIALQADVGITGATAKYSEPICLPFFPQNLIGVAGVQRV